MSSDKVARREIELGKHDQLSSRKFGYSAIQVRLRIGQTHASAVLVRPESITEGEQADQASHPILCRECS